MTIYWERCSFCGRYHVIRQCTMYSDVLVCPYCCFSCPKRENCPKPVWVVEAKVRVAKEYKKPIPPKREAEKILLDLLSRLESSSSSEK